MTDQKMCRNCRHWHYTQAFAGNCDLRQWDRDKWAQTASPAYMGCRDYAERQIEMAAAKET